MTVYISLLRGINVGGHKKIKMAGLQTLYTTLGLTDVQTLLQSGNVVFGSDQTDRAALIAQIETAIETTYGFHSHILLRTLPEWQAVIDAHPFPSLDEPGKLMFMFLSAAPDPAAIDALAAAHAGPETITLVGATAYLYFPNGLGRSKLTNAFIERHLAVVGTMRNWNTTLKLRALAAAHPAA